ncbi:amino acid/polyamine transporter I [Aspergillus ambiguus]|uniref:putative GABA permease n=1 Tax=Aspergillus ambiguus TaxID=176160 RepID=UPI003CCD1E7F
MASNKLVSIEIDVQDIGTYVHDMETEYDENDMSRMGKLQELKRNLRPLAALSFASVLQATWEFLLISNTQALDNGGMAGLLWTYMWTFTGFCFIIASLSEMASMAPTSGCQYHWVSEFASPRYQRVLSYITGWMSVLAWQAGAASGSFLTGTVIQALISVGNEHYRPQNWRATLLVFSMIILIFLFNVYAGKYVSPIQNILLVLHILSWVATVIVLWTMAPCQNAKSVFTEFQVSAGWDKIGLALLIGQVSAIYRSLSSDATAHMSEEVRNAGRYVPLAMFWGFVINGILAFIIISTLLFAMPSVNNALNDPSGFPFIYVFKQAVSPAGVKGLTAIILIPVIFSNILFNASTARQTYAFARDKGLPFSTWIATIDQKSKLPVNSIGLSCVISGLLSLINIGSDTAFNAIISLNVAALMWAYAVSITCVIYRKLYYAETLPARRWSLGRYGICVNVVALLYVIFALFWSFWPSEVPVTRTNFNWNVVLFSGVLIISVFMYFAKGRNEYKGPVVNVKTT